MLLALKFNLNRGYKIRSPLWKNLPLATLSSESMEIKSQQLPTYTSGAKLVLIVWMSHIFEGGLDQCDFVQVLSLNGYRRVSK